MTCPELLLAWYSLGRTAGTDSHHPSHPPVPPGLLGEPVDDQTLELRLQEVAYASDAKCVTLQSCQSQQSFVKAKRVATVSSAVSDLLHSTA